MKWVKSASADAGWIAGEYSINLWDTDEWIVLREGRYIGQHRCLAGAKRIAQWCADSKAARKGVAS